MNVYKHFYEIRGKGEKKNTKKILRKFKNNWSVLNIAEILKKLPFLRKYSLNFGTFEILKKFWINQVKNSANLQILYKTYQNLFNCRLHD